MYNAKKASQGGCRFCKGLREKWMEIFWEDASGLFVALWDVYPIRPGHALLIPKRHAMYLRDLDVFEQAHLIRAVVDLKAQVSNTNLTAVYEMLRSHPRVVAEPKFVDAAQALLNTVGNGPPAAYNDGINDGVAAGQVVPHMHWHIIPRWEGDIEDPDGGIRHMFAGLGAYE